LGCKFTQKKRKKKILKTFDTTKMGEKKRNKKEKPLWWRAFLGRRRRRRLGSSLGLGCFQSRNATCRSQTADTKGDSLEKKKGQTRLPVLWS
jgi:hypothetical protein